MSDLRLQWRTLVRPVPISLAHVLEEDLWYLRFELVNGSYRYPWPHEYTEGLDLQHLDERVEKAAEVIDGGKSSIETEGAVVGEAMESVVYEFAAIEGPWGVIVLGKKLASLQSSAQNMIAWETLVGVTRVGITNYAYDLAALRTLPEVPALRRHA